MSHKIYIVTKDKYSGHQRTLGFFRFQNQDLYYDFGMLNGSHNSYHKDGSQWRTSLASEGRAKKESEHYPLAQFIGFFNLGTACISKNIVPKLPKVKKKYFNKYETYEIDLESFPSDQLNIVSELIEPEYEIPLPASEKCYPPEAVVEVFKYNKLWLILTILGHEHNLLIVPNGKTTTVNHYNERFTANNKGQSYSSEAYSSKAFDMYSKET
ncbi:hypothetical protein [Vibrio atlanticus]|uniref:hypothetical protein n=1 Tax=Vibrio atlanticus TaxID=693153 RepID=UPI00354CFB8A